MIIEGIIIAVCAAGGTISIVTLIACALGDI